MPVVAIPGNRALAAIRRGVTLYLHVIDDDLAVQHLASKKVRRHRLALGCKAQSDAFFFCIVPSQNLDHASNADAIDACYASRSHWPQATSRQSETAEGYKTDYAK